jgi:hypothetical protein
MIDDQDLRHPTPCSAASLFVGVSTIASETSLVINGTGGAVNRKNSCDENQNDERLPDQASALAVSRIAKQ